MRSLARSTLPTTIALGLTAAAAAGAALSRTGSSNVEFRAKGPVGMSIIGRTFRPRGRRRRQDAAGEGSAR